MSEPLSNAALDRLLGLAPAPPAPRADLVERIVAEATRPGRRRARPAARRSSRRGWRRTSLITGIIAFNLLAASAIASVLSGVPVHLALARLAALPAHLFHRHHSIEHAAHHAHVRAHEPMRAVTGGASGQGVAEAGANRPSLAPPLSNIARPVAAVPATRPTVAAKPAQQLGRSRIAIASVNRALSPSTDKIHAHPRHSQNTLSAVNTRQGVGARDRAMLRAEHARRTATPRREADRAPMANRTDHVIDHGRNMRAERADPPRHAETSAETFTANSRAQQGRAGSMGREVLPGPSASDRPAQPLNNRGPGQRPGTGMGRRPRWANEVVVNPALDGSPTARAPMRGEPQMAQERSARAERPFEARQQRMAQGRAQGAGAAFRPGQRPGWRAQHPQRPPNMRPNPKRPGGFGRAPRGGGQRR